SAASRRMRWAISADCTGDPPGELMASATAFAPGKAKARASKGATVSIDSPRRPSTAPAAITPESRTTGTAGPRRRRFLNQSNMARTVATRRLEGKRLATPQYRLGLVGVAAVGPVQDQRRTLLSVGLVGAARPDQHALGGRQRLHRQITPTQPLEMGGDLVQA